MATTLHIHIHIHVQCQVNKAQSKFLGVKGAPSQARHLNNSGGRSIETHKHKQNIHREILQIPKLSLQIKS